VCVWSVFGVVMCVFVYVVCVCVSSFMSFLMCVWCINIVYYHYNTHTHHTHTVQNRSSFRDRLCPHAYRHRTCRHLLHTHTFRTVFLKDIPAGKQTHTQKDTQDNDNKTSELSIAISKLFYYLRDNHGTDSALEFLDTIHGAWRTLTTNTVIGYFSKFLNNEEVASDVAHTSLDAQSEYSVLYERSAEFYVEKGLQVCVCVCMCGVCIYGLVCFLVGLSYA